MPKAYGRMRRDDNGESVVGLCWSSKINLIGEDQDIYAIVIPTAYEIDLFTKDARTGNYRVIQDPPNQPFSVRIWQIERELNGKWHKLYLRYSHDDVPIALCFENADDAQDYTQMIIEGSHGIKFLSPIAIFNGFTDG